MLINVYLIYDFTLKLNDFIYYLLIIYKIYRFTYLLLFVFNPNLLLLPLQFSQFYFYFSF